MRVSRCCFAHWPPDEDDVVDHSATQVGHTRQSPPLTEAVGPKESETGLLLAKMVVARRNSCSAEAIKGNRGSRRSVLGLWLVARAFRTVPPRRGRGGSAALPRRADQEQFRCAVGCSSGSACTAVDVDHLAGDEACAGGGEEVHGVGDFLRLAVPAQRGP